MATEYESQETQTSGWGIFQDGLNAWKAQTFTPTITHYITSVKLYLYKVGSPTGNVNITIRATASGLPTGSDLASGTVATADVGVDYAWYEASFSASCLLSANIKYAVVVNVPGAPNTDNKIVWGNAADVYSGGSYCHSSDGSTWTAQTLYDFCFQDWGDPAFAPKVWIM